MSLPECFSFEVGRIQTLVEQVNTRNLNNFVSEVSSLFASIREYVDDLKEQQFAEDDLIHSLVKLVDAVERSKISPSGPSNDLQLARNEAKLAADRFEDFMGSVKPNESAKILGIA